MDHQKFSERHGNGIPSCCKQKLRTEEPLVSSIGAGVAVVVVGPYYNGDEWGPRRDGKDRWIQLPVLLSWSYPRESHCSSRH